jgi:hypothetical protein
VGKALFLIAYPTSLIRIHKCTVGLTIYVMGPLAEASVGEYSLMEVTTTLTSAWVAIALEGWAIYLQNHRHGAVAA